MSGVAAASAGLWLARGTTAAGLDGSSNVALYWGQNSYNQGTGDLAQQSLATYCSNTDIDIIPMAFMVQITSGQGKEPVINFANQQNNCTVFSDTGLLDCPQIGEDIKTCQQKYGKTILLSIGGATYTEGGFTSKDAAIAAANLVWDTFGPASGSSSSNSSTPSPTSNSTSLVGSAHSTTSSPLSTGGTGQVAATTNASTNLLPTLSTILDVNSSTTAKANKVKSTGKLTKASATTSDDEVLTVVTTFLTTMSEATTTLKTTLKNKAAETSSAHSHSTKTKQEVTVVTSLHTYLSTKTLKQTNAETTTSLLRMTRTHGGLHRIPASAKSSTATASSSKAATTEATAETLDYDATHPHRRQAKANRPFHDAVIDGFDLDLETAVQNFNPFATQLRMLMDADKSKKYYLTAAPQCPYPDAADDSMLNGAAGMEKVKFDAIFVQFYNNYCGTNAFIPNTTTQNNFNFAVWDNWATTKSANKDVKVFLGVPAGQSAAGTGYLSSDALKPVIDYCKTFASFGGVMAWDASQAYANKGFLEGVKSSLGDATKRARLIRRTIAREWWG
ncbi:hypothetical protein PRZ48_011294 [Zasmidium cellare]|uniref:chitinase n=1 Tax=Zasmidium cellare TaxID=395010 RepID=A0ABR0E663_ZASCE|nr:hypothetical protein PRZ48_011294 [Zasmidium cellare]